MRTRRAVTSLFPDSQHKPDLFTLGRIRARALVPVQTAWVRCTPSACRLHRGGDGGNLVLNRRGNKQEPGVEAKCALV